MGYGIKGRVVDGNDLLAVYAVTRTLLTWRELATDLLSSSR